MADKMIITGALFLVSIALGVWLSRKGRPLNTPLSIIHKLESLTASVFLALSVFDTPGLYWKGTIPAVLSVAAMSMVVALIASGAVLSGKRPNGALKIAHAVEAAIALLCLGGSVIL